MDNKYKQKKQPELVKSRLMQAAAEVAAERGLPGLTLDLVAARAGVSKGGLIHHYANRQALVTALFYSLLAAFQRGIEANIADDECPRGRFTRAYVKASAAPGGLPGAGKPLGSFALSMSNDSALAALWAAWLDGQLARHGEEASSVAGRAIRYAADGIWLEECGGGGAHSPEERRAVVEHLINLSREL